MEVRMNTNELIALAESYGIKDYDLDDEVHDIKDEEAADICNDGISSQIRFLVSAIGEYGVEKLLNKIKNDL
jgi:hypothetical protein